jgi:hypothetical protein
MPKVDAPAPGTALKETKFTEVVSAAQAGGSDESRSYDAIEYMEKMKPEDWANITAYIYRIEPPVWRGAGEKTQVGQFTDFFDLMTLQKQFGGGVFRILLRNTKTRERVADSKHGLGGTPRDLTRDVQEFASSTFSGVPTQTDTASGITPGGVVSKAMDMVGNTEAQRAQVEMVKTTATDMVHMVREAMPKQLSVQEIIVLAKELAPKANSFLESPLGIALAGKLIDRLFADPTDQFIKMADIMTRINGGSSAGDWKAALVQAAPQLAMAVKDTVQELRLGTEAQMRLNAGRTLNAAPPPPPPPAAPNPGATAPNPDAHNVVEMPAPQTGGTGMEPFETKLVELLNDPNMDGEKAGEILDQQWPRIVDEITLYSVDQIMGAFATRPILQPHAQNPRLRQFITEFLEWAKETDTPPLTPPAPAA